MVTADIQQYNKDDVILAVLESEALGTSKHQIDLFKYLINRKFDDKLHGIKAYTIAMDVFGRGSDFDGSTDSIVRVEMFRLRANLKSFNESSDTFHLELQKASYNIRIKRKSDKTNSRKSPQYEFIRSRGFFSSLLATLVLALIIISFYWGRHLGSKIQLACSERLPSVAVENVGNTGSMAAYVNQIILNTIRQYSHFETVQSFRGCESTGAPAYKISYSILDDNDSYRGFLTLEKLGAKDVLLSKNFNGSWSEKSASDTDKYDDLYVSLVQTLNDWVRSGGTLHRDAANTQWRDQVKQSQYSCIDIMYQSFILDGDDGYSQALDCFLEATSDPNPLVDNLGGLATSYIAQHQNSREKTVNSPIHEAKLLMDRVGDEWSNYIETTVAKIYWEAERPDYNSQRLLDTIQLAIKKYPSNPIILLEAAKYSGFRLGNWGFADELAQRAQRFQSAQDNSVFFIDAARTLLTKDPSVFFERCLATYSENSKLSNLLVNACATKAQNNTWKQKTDLNLVRLSLNTKADRLAFFQSRKYDPNLIGVLEGIWGGNYE